MDEELLKNILRILEELPDENCCIEYKEIPYKEEKYMKASFIKDICGFVNSSEAYGKDKFIIIGIRNSTKERIGIKIIPMEDDERYQSWCDYIEPRPTIETGRIKYKELEYGYIYIPKNNDERIYSIKEDFPSEYVLREDELQNYKTKVYASVAYTRNGSKNCTLTEYERRKIYENDRKIKELKVKDFKQYTDTISDDNNKEIMKICALFGTWNENNEYEKRILSSSIGSEYNVWIKTLRKLLNQKSEYVSLKNNKWKIEKKEELIEMYSEDYFEEDIKRLEEATIKIVAEVDPKFDLETNNRVMSNIIGKKCIYSKEIKKSVLETFAYIKSINSKCINCEKEIKKSQWYIVRELLQNSNWKNLATLNDLLPLLAEIDEDEYISQIEEIIKNKTKELKILFAEKEEYVSIIDYTYGLIWSLELLAWNKNYIMQVFDIFGKLAIYDENEKVIDSMSRILLPWYPQTNADINIRKATLEMMLKEYNDVGWKLLTKILPNQQTHSFPTYKPKWNNLIDEEDFKITNKELYEQNMEYIKLAITYSKINKDRIIKLINELDDVPKGLFELICNKLTSEEVKNIKEEERFDIWDELENLIARHKAHEEQEWSLPKEAILKLEKVSKEIKPEKEEIYYKRLFNRNYWDCFNGKESYELQEKKLLEKQKKVIKKLLQKGLTKVINFAKTTKDSYRVGIALSEIPLKADEEIQILKILDTDDYQIAQGYVYRKFYNEKFNWIESIDIRELNKIGKVRFLVKLPNNKRVWNFAKEILENNENDYWKDVDIRFVDSDSEYNYPLEKLLDCKRPIKALELISMALHEKREFSEDLAAKALEEGVKDQENINYIDVYHIKRIIEFLQENNYDETKLFKIEWTYLPILDSDDKYRPNTIEKKISEDPKIFMEIICLAFKAENDDENKENSNTKLATNAYKLLSIWKMVPGTDEKGAIDKKILRNWYDEMKKIAVEKDRLEVSLIHFGQVLFYTPKSEDGFWIDKSVLELLNEDDSEKIRRGYATAAFNSVGVVNVDSEGTAWLNLEKEWSEKAESIDAKYFRFKKTLKDIAQNFHEHALYMKEHYDF